MGRWTHPVGHFSFMVATPVLLCGCATAISSRVGTTTVSFPGCAISSEDKARNALLSFAEFDQTGTTLSTARALADRGCFAQAAEAGEDYLARVQLTSEREQTSVVFHIAQNLAMAGEADRAASTVVAAKRVTRPAQGDFDWNSYVVGTWAFLKRDRATLTEHYDRLNAGTSHGDRINARVLRGLLECFDRRYVTAYRPGCRDNLMNSADQTQPLGKTAIR